MSINAIPDLYVLWHPECVLGELLARQVYAWLRPGNGLGPQVFYRSLVAPDAAPDGLPMALPGEVRPAAHAYAVASSSHVNMQIVILLIDDHMVADAAWRYWLTSLSRITAPGVRRVFLPVALDSTAFNIPNPLRELNFLRPAGLPLPAESGVTREAALNAVIRSLLKQLTEMLCRLLLASTEAAQPAPAAGYDVLPKISIFLSHAKADGTTPAKRIRDYIYSQTQLAAFYDENDIPFGSIFSRVLQSSLQSTQTAALIAVRSARYAGRPWCRRELSMFRRPWRVTPEAVLPERWRLHPIVIVDALEPGSQTAGVPEFGNATLIRWAGDEADQEERIVTTVLRDALLAAFHSALGQSLAGTPDSIVLNWLPDPTTLLHIPRVRQALNEVQVFYPGRGLSGLELDILDEYFPSVSFRSFDQATV